MSSKLSAAEGGFQRGDDVHQLVGVLSRSISMYNTSLPRFLNSTPLPSITGLLACAPMLPKPSTAVPLEITATKLPLVVYL